MATPPDPSGAGATPAFPPVPVDGHSATWISEGGSTVETCTMRWENEAWTAEGFVSVVDVQYVIRYSSAWRPQQFLLFRDLDDPDLWLATDGHGRWGEVNGVQRVELDGCTDVMMAVSPMAHTGVVRRARLAIGDGVDVDVIDVDVETLAMCAVRRRYVRTGASTYTCDDEPFEVDPYGIPLDVGSRFRRGLSG